MQLPPKKKQVTLSKMQDKNAHILYNKEKYLNLVVLAMVYV